MPLLHVNQLLYTFQAGSGFYHIMFCPVAGACNIKVPHIREFIFVQK
jgi:hypothetical protein